jgi:hypothetical protein
VFFDILIRVLILGFGLGVVCRFDWEIFFLAAVIGLWLRLMMLRGILNWRLMMPRLLMLFYWSFVFEVIFLGVIYYFLKFFIDSYNCIIRVVVLSIGALIVFGGGLDLDTAFSDHGVAEGLE